MGEQTKVLRSTERPLSGKGPKVSLGPAPTMTAQCCVFGCPVKMARPEEKGEPHAASSASLLGKAPKATCLPFQRSAPPWAARARVTAHPRGQRQAHRSARSHTRAAGQTWCPACRCCWPRSGRDSLSVLQQVPPEADRSTRHASPAPGLPGMAGPSANVCCWLPG